jgi:hypothetical protein
VTRAEAQLVLSRESTKSHSEEWGETFSNFVVVQYSVVVSAGEGASFHSLGKTKPDAGGCLAAIIFSRSKDTPLHSPAHSIGGAKAKSVTEARI